MKNYIYVIEKETKRYYGGRNTSGSIYRMKRNKPIFVTNFFYCTAGHKGETSEILTAIANTKGQLTKREASCFKGLYFDWTAATEANIKIYRVGH